MAAPTELFAKPEAAAIAFTVVAALTAIGPAYFDDPVEGVEPSRV